MSQRNFMTRYDNLNTNQRQAVDTIDGPLLVIAGPGTGKTELLSMRAAAILRQTDTLPENILCLTFTDSGANAMRQRLRDIIGADAYRVAIHTFHSFGSESINQHREYFYRGATFSPTDEIGKYKLLRTILAQLSHRNPLSSKQSGEFTYLRDISTSISELKQAGLSAKELLQIITANENLLNTIEPAITEVFAQRINLQIVGKLVPITKQIAQLPLPELPPTISPLADGLSLSLARAVDIALDTGKTTELTAWRNRWCEKNTKGDYVFKDRKRLAKLHALAGVYQSYLEDLAADGLYDYDDMILELAQTIETQPDLRYNLQERYQYIMVDEFQDTNLAQLRILFALTDNPVHEGRPNIMAVGDDDQAIYSFQGADIGNIHKFLQQYQDVGLITLTDNYRSSSKILKAARSVITQGSERLETTLLELDKTLTPHHKPASGTTNLYELPTQIAERQWLAKHIRQAIDTGISPGDIAVITRRHRELIALVPYLHAEGISVNYERRDNILELPIIKILELLGRTVNALAKGDIQLANSLLPEILAHPAFGINNQDIWQLSLRAWRNRQTWTETMLATSTFRPMMTWLLLQAQQSLTTPLEYIVDALLGVPVDSITDSKPQTSSKQSSSNQTSLWLANTDESSFCSPLYEYYFSTKQREQHPDTYLTFLEALRTLRNHLYDYQGVDKTLYLPDLLDLCALHREFNTPITSLRQRATNNTNNITLLTAHKAKGLEFNQVYVCGAVDNVWGQRVRTPSRLITYPDNLTIAPVGSTYNERLRLFFVAMTRAKNTLIISYSTQDDSGRPTLPASFLTATGLNPTSVDAASQITQVTDQLITDWRRYLVPTNPSSSLKQLLQPVLEQYKLSATDLTAFLDVTRGGPNAFLLNNLLHFPQSRSAHALYGTAMHRVLQRAHTHVTATGKIRPTEDVLGDFQQELSRQPLAAEDITYFMRKGVDSLNVFLRDRADTFRPEQKTELSFVNQQAIYGSAHLTGTLDLVDIDTKANTIAVTDYKTGRPAHRWHGRTDYEKLKLHRYRQQLMFYELLVRHSRDYAKYQFTGATIQFVEPDDIGSIHQLHTQFSQNELDQFGKLLIAVWQCITTLQLPDTSQYPTTYAGVMAFEEALCNTQTDKTKSS